MKPTFAGKIVSTLSLGSFGLLAITFAATAQDTPHAWRTADGQAPQYTADQRPPDQNEPGTPPSYQYPSNAPGNRNADPRNSDPGNPDRGNYDSRNNSVPGNLTIKAGTFVTVRINQWLSSDRNQQGDAFFATLAQPLVVDGVVVAPAGGTVSGRITEALKAGRVEGTSRLGMELTELTLADGQQAGIRSQMITRAGSTSQGRDAAAIGGTTALGAAIGASADWGRGAAIGAGAGAAAGILGALLTRGQPTVVPPELVLTFRIEEPVTFSTERAPQAFRYVDTQDYGPRYAAQGPPPRQSGQPCYNCAPPPPAPYPYYSPYYGPGYYPYAYGGGFSVYIGPRYYRGGFYGRGYRR